MTVAGSEAQLDPGATLNLGRDGSSPLARALSGLEHISREHARIERRDDGIWITDLGSLNGTYLDERRLEPQKGERVEAGAAIRLASNVPVEILDADEPVEGRP